MTDEEKGQTVVVFLAGLVFVVVFIMLGYSLGTDSRIVNERLDRIERKLGVDVESKH